MRGYVEEIAYRYFLKKGYLIASDVPFYLSKEITGKQVSGWSDIDLVAYNSKELAIVQCTTYITDRQRANYYVEWFTHAENFVKSTPPYSNLLKTNIQLTKYFITDSNQPTYEQTIRQKGVKIIRFIDMTKELIDIVKKELKELPSGRTYRDEDALLKLISRLIEEEHKMVKEGERTYGE